MATTNKERKRETARLYRERNAEALKAYKASWYQANKDQCALAQKARYEQKKPAILAQQQEYIIRKTEALGINPRTLQARKYRAANLERCRAYARTAAAKSYRSDPMKAAIKRAKTILAAQSGVPTKGLAQEIVDAKALQLLVRSEALCPGRVVGHVLSDSERSMRRAASWQKWYAKNKEHRAEYQRQRRVAQGIAARSDTTGTGVAEGKSPVRDSECAQPGDAT